MLVKTREGKRQLFFPIEVSEDLGRGGLANKLATNLDVLKSNFFPLFGSN